MSDSPYAYLAEPIDESTGITSAQLRAALHMRGTPFYSPRVAWQGLRAPFSPVIQQTNNVALASASVIVAVLPRNVPSVGVPMELQQARSAGIPCVILSDRTRKASAVFAEFPCMWTDSPEQAAMATQTHLHREPDTIPLFTEPAGVLVARYTTDDGSMPRTGKEGDAGYDLTCTADLTLDVGAQGQVPCGISVQLPDGYWCLIQGRSSSWKRGISVKASVIDAGYRGQLWIDCHNIGRELVHIAAGERIAQLIPMQLPPRFDWQKVDGLEPSERGSSGYGSTGR